MPVSDVAHKRPQRIAQLLHKELSALTVAGLRDPRIGLVTITEVRVSDDLKTAQVFVSVLGDEATRKGTLTALGQAAGFLKREVTHRLNLRFAPNLYFSYDDSLARAHRVEALLQAAAQGREIPETPEDAALPEIFLDRSSPVVIEPPARPSRKGKPAKSGTKRRRFTGLKSKSRPKR